MAFAAGISILHCPSSFSDKIQKADFPEKLGLTFKSDIFTPRSFIDREPRRHSVPKFSTTRSGVWQGTCPESLQIFVIGPSIFGKKKLIECVAGQTLGIPTRMNMFHAYTLSGFLLKGVEVEIKLWHVGNINGSLKTLQDFYHTFKTCFMLVYDVNDSTTFEDAHKWIPSLRRVLDISVPIVLVGYEDYGDTLLTAKMSPVSFSDGLKAKQIFDLKTFYEFSDMTGTAVCELVFDAAHIALESNDMTPDSELAESEENDEINDSYVCVGTGNN